MKTHTKRPVQLIVLCLSGILGLFSCKNDPRPIPVFVTPTPAEVVQVISPTVTSSPVPSLTETPLPSATPAPSQTPAPTVTPVPSDTPAPTATLTPTPAPLPSNTPFPTPIPPDVTYGAIIGPDYVPEPLHTALPSDLRERPCPAIVSAAQVSLYVSPDRAAQVVGTATAREQLTASELFTAAGGDVWANTPGGWLPLSEQGAELARLGSMRACDILRGRIQPSTLMGLHVLNGTSRAPVLAFVRMLAGHGIPMATIKGLTGAEEILNEVENISPETVTVYRSLLSPEGGDCPDGILDLPDPEETAQRWMASLEPLWAPVNADYFEFINECPAPLDWLTRFSIEAMRIANEQNRCLLLYSFPGGSPNMEQFDQLLPAYQYALDNPCQPGRTHGIALHAYSLEDTRLASESDVWIVFRHRLMYERLLNVLPAAVNVPVFITEWGQGGGTYITDQTISCADVVRDVLQYTYQLEEDPYVVGFHLWSVGSGTIWRDLTSCLDMIGPALLQYYGK